MVCQGNATRLLIESRHVHMLFFFNIMFVLIHVTDLPPFVCCLFISSLIHMTISMDDGDRSAQQQWRSNVLAFTLRHRRWWFQPQLQEMLVKMGSSSPQVFGNEHLKEGIWSSSPKRKRGNFKNMKTRTYLKFNYIHQLPSSHYVTMGEEMIKSLDCNTWERDHRGAPMKMPEMPCQCHQYLMASVVPKVSPCFFAKKHGQNCQFPWGAMEPP